MGLRESTEQMMTLPQQVSLLELAAHFQLLLKDAGLGIRQGIILQAENSETLGEFFDLAEQLGARVITGQRQMMLCYPNDRMVLIHFQRIYKEGILEEFLARRDITPVVAISGMLPTSLRNCGEVVCIAVGKEDDNQKEEMDEYKQFLDYAHEHPDIIYGWFKQFRTSLRYDQLKEVSRIRVSLETVAYALCGFFRKAHGEQEAKYRMLRLRKYVEWMCQAADNGQDDMDVVKDIQGCLFKFLDEHSEMWIGPIVQAGDRIKKATDAEAIMLYDSDFYFIPEKLLREACTPILNAVSFLRLKEALRETGCLVCNRTNIQNYTVKKLLWTTSGEVIRPRFLKMDKLMLDNTTQLTIEERSGEDVFGENGRQSVQNQQGISE